MSERRKVLDVEIKKIMEELGFEEEDFTRPESTQDVLYIERPHAKLQLSESTLKNWLQENKKHFISKQAWHTPLGTFLPLLLAMMTATFKDVLGLKSQTCQSIWIFIIVGVLIWLGFSLYRCWKSKKEDDMIDDLKKGMFRTILQ